MEVRKPLGFILDLSAGSFWKRLEGLNLDPAALVAPGSGDGTVDQEGASGRIWVRRAWTSGLASQVGKKARIT